MIPLFGSQTFITPYGLMLITGLIVGWRLARREALHANIDPSHIDFLAPMSFLIGLLAALAISRLMVFDLQFASAEFTAQARGRLPIIVTFGALTIFVYSRLNALSFRGLLDIFTLPTLATIVAVRIGCFMAGCCWGDLAVSHDALANHSIANQVQTLPWLSGHLSALSVTFPAGSFAFEQHLALGLVDSSNSHSLPVHPVQLYEVATVLLLLIVLRKFPLSGSRPGSLAGIATAAYASLRFLLEFVRADGALVLEWLSVVQVECVVLLVLAVIAIRINRMAAFDR